MITEEWLRERVEVYLSTRVSDRWPSENSPERLIAQIELEKFIKWFFRK